MRTKILVVAIVVGLTGVGYGIVGNHTVEARPAKNLKVFPKGMDTKQLKPIMKAWSKALGVDCDYCHDTDNFASDKKRHKKIARKMVGIAKQATNQVMRATGKRRIQVTCQTCHNGRKKPKR